MITTVIPWNNYFIFLVHVVLYNVGTNERALFLVSTNQELMGLLPANGVLTHRKVHLDLSYLTLLTGNVLSTHIC